MAKRTIPNKIYKRDWKRETDMGAFRVVCLGVSAQESRDHSTHTQRRKKKRGENATREKLMMLVLTLRIKQSAILVGPGERLVVRSA